MFSFHYADRATQEAWCFNPSGADAAELFDFLCDMCKLTWGEIERQSTGGKNRHNKHHDLPISKIATNAQKDLSRRQLGARFGGDIFRFRLSGVKRLWGYRRGRVFHVVWWDDQHEVYPTDPS